MVKRFLIGAAFCLALGAAPLYAQASSAPVPGEDSAKPENNDSLFDVVQEAKMLAWVNEERAKAGVDPLKPNRLLTLSARKHLLRMVRSGELSHEFNDERSLMDRVAEQGTRFSATAENLAMATLADDMHTGLMNSPGHRANILSPEYDSIGVAVVRYGKEYWSTQHFAHTTPALSAVEAEATFGRYVQELRESTRMNRIKVVASPEVRAAVCKMAASDQVKVASLPSEDRLDQWNEGLVHSQRGAYAFTSLDLKDWPEKLKDVVTAPSMQRMYVGACYVKTPKLPGGAFWFGVLF